MTQIVTKQKLETAFLQLYRTAPIEKITIRSITELAGLNRCTFYAHFTDIYDLSNQIEAEIEEEISVAIQKISLPLNSTSMEIFIKEIMKIYKIRGNALPIFLTRPHSNLQTHLKSVVKNYIISGTPNLNGDDSLLLEYALEYQLSAVIGVISFWLQKYNGSNLDELFSHIYELSTKGFFATLNRLTSPKVI